MKIALVELSSSHDECLYAQIKALKVQNISVHLICNEKLKDRVSIFNDITDFTFLPSKLTLLDLFRLWRKLYHFDKIIFNTASGIVIRNLLFFPFSKSTELIGIIHNTKKILTSGSQRFISRKVKKYFVLNDYLLDTIPNKPRTIKIASFYPICFPKPTVQQIKPSGDIWVCIPGQVETKRRDYLGFLDALKGFKIPPNIKFILLGKGAHKHGNGLEVRSKIEELGFSSQFRLWDDFIGTQEFNNYLYNADFILPLIHPEKESFHLYTHQITGAFNLAFGLKIPLLMHKVFKSNSDFTDTSLFYSLDNLQSIICDLQIVKSPNYQLDKWSATYQKDAYWSLLNN